MAQAALRDFNGAIAAFSDAIRLKPDYAIAYYYRGLAFQQSGDSGLGAKDIEHAKSLGFTPPKE